MTHENKADHTATPEAVDWTTDPRFGTDDRPAGSLDELEALCRRRLAEIVGPSGPEFAAQVFRYGREWQRWSNITGEQDSTPWVTIEELGDVYAGALGVGIEEYDEIEVCGRNAFGHERDGGKAASAHPWDLIEPYGTLDALLAEDTDRSEPAWRITDVWPAGGRIVLSAPAKGGKSTLVGNLLRSLVDGARLFGPPVAGIIGDPDVHVGYAVTPLPAGDGVALIDTELDRGMLRRWLGDQGIRNTRRLHLEMYRGRLAELDVRDPDIRAKLAARLRAARVRVIVIDPVGPVLAELGLDEARNPDVRRYLEALAQLAREAGAAELLVVHHMGHGADRARGASAWRDWPDAEWRLTRSGEGGAAPRYFTATGRDVEVAEVPLRYDPDGRRLTVGDRLAEAADRHSTAALAVVTSTPGITTRNLEAALLGSVGGSVVVRAAMAAARDAGLIHVHPGANRAQAHYPGPGGADCRCVEQAA